MQIVNSTFQILERVECESASIPLSFEALDDKPNGAVKIDGLWSRKHGKIIWMMALSSIVVQQWHWKSAWWLSPGVNIGSLFTQQSYNWLSYYDTPWLIGWPKGNDSNGATAAHNYKYCASLSSVRTTLVICTYIPNLMSVSLPLLSQARRIMNKRLQYSTRRLFSAVETIASFSFSILIFSYRLSYEHNWDRAAWVMHLAANMTWP